MCFINLRRGQRIGTVSRLDGNAAVVVSSIPRARLTGHAKARASANSAAHAGH